MLHGGRSAASRRGTKRERMKQKSRYQRKQQRKKASKKIMRLEHNHHFEPTSRTRFHADHTYLCIGVMQITNGESSEVFCSCLVGGRGPGRKCTPNKAWCVVLRNVVEGVTFWIHLEKTILGMYLGKHELAPTRALGCACAGIPWARPTSGNTYAGFYCQSVISQKRARQQVDGSY